MARPRHPNKEIEAAVTYAENKGWSVKMSTGHPWATLWCREHSTAGCHFSVSSTPANPSAHARQIKRRVDSCPH